MDAERRARLGQKWACFSCGRKFYDLNREEPICPRCESDQRNAPPPEKRRIGAKKKATKKKATKKAAKKTTKKTTEEATKEPTKEAPKKATKKTTKEAPKKATKGAKKKATKKAGNPSPAADDEAELGIDDEVEDIDLNEANLGNDTDVAS